MLLKAAAKSASIAVGIVAFMAVVGIPPLQHVGVVALIACVVFLGGMIYFVDMSLLLGTNKRVSSGQEQLLLRDLRWSFTGGSFDNPRDFVAAVSEYQAQLGLGREWQEDAVVIVAPRIAIVYSLFGVDHSETELEQRFVLQSDQGEHFTAGELLMKIHNAVVAQLRDEDAHFFQGLVLDKSHIGPIPTYGLLLGS